MMKNSMSPRAWKEKECVALAYLGEKLPKLPTVLTAKAWLGCGIK
jgi:hypothetical protein